MVYGWLPQPDYSATKCIVLFGHNPKRHSWTPAYNKIRSAQARGAKLIVLDPRRSENAELADLWLPLRAGTDAAMMLGWLNVIINERLYDKEFVTRWTIGFDALKLRVEEYSVDRVAAITGVNPDLIREAARLYATTKPGVIPWAPITDQQISSTSAIRLQCTLRALAGNIDVKGGETLQGLNPFVVSESELELHEVLSDTPKSQAARIGSAPCFHLSGRDDRIFQTGHRHVPELRRLHPEPKLFVDPVTAREYGLVEGDWACIETRGGRMFSITELRPEMPRGLVRVPHGWWKPETRQGKESLSSAWLTASLSSAFRTSATTMSSPTSRRSNT